MLREVVSAAAWSSFAWLLAALPAQKTLAAVQREFQAEAKKLEATSPSREQINQLVARQLVVLKAFVDKEAAGDDRWNGRVMVADLQLQAGDRKSAAETLRGIDPKEAPPLVLINAAAMAQHLGMKEQRGAWVDAALGKDAPFDEKLAIARLLWVPLYEQQRGEKVFADLLAAAADDEQRSFIRWYKADALREREDLPENAAYDELEKLAKELPGTYWGSVAKDRLRATRLQVGDDAIGFRTKTRDGKDAALGDFAGKGLVLVFWSAGDRDLPALVTMLDELQKRHGDKLAVLGICLDRDPAQIAADIERLKIKFPVVADGKGEQNDVALRWFVGAPVVNVVDTKGKVAGLGLHAGTADGKTQLNEAVERAVKS